MNMDNNFFKKILEEGDKKGGSAAFNRKIDNQIKSMEDKIENTTLTPEYMDTLSPEVQNERINNFYKSKDNLQKVKKMRQDLFSKDSPSLN